MALPLTQIEGVPQRDGLICGTAYFSGTGPSDRHCGSCKHYGYYRLSRFNKSYRTMGCHMFKKLTGKHGPRLKKWTASCKYYEEKVNAKHGAPEGASVGG